MKQKVKIAIEVPRSKQSRSARLAALANREGWRPTIHHPTGSKYTGQWHINEKHGVGEYISRKDRLFNGYMVHDKPDIYGVSAFGRGKNIYEIEYRGEWKDGFFHGKGILHYRNQSIFRGTFVYSKREGYGQMWYRDGSYYEGNWLNDLREGEGVFVETNSNRYEGSWHKGLKHGRGRYFFLNTGQYMDGIWDHGVPASSIVADIPYRQTSLEPTPYTINEVQLDDEANQVIDIIENTLLNLQVSSELLYPTDVIESKHIVKLNFDVQPPAT